MTDIPTFTAADKREAAEREARFRRRVYPRWVEQKKMTQAHADKQIALMDAIAADYRVAAAAQELPLK